MDTLLAEKLTDMGGGYKYEKMHEYTGAQQEEATCMRCLIDLARFVVRSENYEGPSLKFICTRAVSKKKLPERGVCTD